MATSRTATNSTVEQGLVVRRTHPAHRSWKHGGRHGTSNGREGTGRGDAARLLSRRNLRRVWRHRGRRKPEESSGFIDYGARGCASTWHATRQRVSGQDEPSSAGIAATRDPRLDGRRRPSGVPDEAGRQDRDDERGNPPPIPRTCSIGACRPWLASQRQAPQSARTGHDGSRDGQTSRRPERRTRGSFRHDSRNVANPMVGCRTQQACRLTRGENRRSREERQGRNEFGPWLVRTEGRASSSKPAWEWTRVDCADGGENLGQPHERRPDEVRVERVR